MGDFDGDGNADLAIAVGVSESETDLHVLYGNGAFGFTDSTAYQSNSSDFFFASGDVNSDGRTDLFGFPDANQLVVLTSQPDRQWTTFSMATTVLLNQAVNRDDHAGPPPLLLGDFNGDGLMDLAATGVQGSGTPQAHQVFDFFLANGSGGYTEQSVPTMSAGNILVGDFNLDGKPDVATVDAFIAYPGTGAQMTGDLVVASQAGSLFLSTPVATVSPVALNFGNVGTGTQSASLAVTVTNSGNSPLQVFGATAAAPFSVQGSVCESPLARGENCVSVTTGQESAWMSLCDGDLRWAGGGFLGCALLLPFVLRRRKALRGVNLVLGIVLTVGLPVLFTGCAGGGSSTQKSPPPPVTVAPGSYSLTITAAAGSNSTTKALTLVVQ